MELSEGALGGAEGDRGVLAMLDSHPFFERFSAEEREALAREVRVRGLSPGEAICREGAPVSEWYLLVEGRARASLTRSDGGQEYVSQLEPGAIFGVVGLLDGGRRELTVAALRPGSCLVFPRSLLEDAGRMSLCLGELLCMALNDQLRAANHRLMCMARDPDAGPGIARPEGGWSPPPGRT